MTMCPERSARVNAVRATGAGVAGLFVGPQHPCAVETEKLRAEGALPPGAPPPAQYHPGARPARTPYAAPARVQWARSGSPAEREAAPEFRSGANQTEDGGRTVPGTPPRAPAVVARAAVRPT